MASSHAYSALGLDDDDDAPRRISVGGGGGLADLRSQSVARSGSAAPAVHFGGALSSAALSALGGGGGGGFQSGSSSSSSSSFLDGGADSTDRLLVPGELRGLGGGLSSSTLEDTRKFRWDKPSRIFRLQRGTKCFRFTLLFLSMLIVYSGYFQFDLPAITVDFLLERLKMTMEQYSTIFVGYSVSNTVVPLFSGPFFSRVGKWKGVVIISATITTGIAIVYGGVVANSYSAVVVGRTIYGLGGESVFVGIDILVTKWFQGAEIGFAYGLIQAAGQAGSFSALYSVPSIIEDFLGGDINGVYLISLMLSCTALAALGIARCLEKTAYGRKAPKHDVEAGLHLNKSVGATVGGGFAAALMDDGLVKGSSKGEKLLGPGGGGGKGKSSEENARLLDGPIAAARTGALDGEMGEEEEDEEEEADTDIVSQELQAQLEANLWWARPIPPLFHLLMFLGIGHMFSLKWRFYCVLGGIICYSSAFYTFLAFGPKWLMTTYKMDEKQAGFTTGTIAIFSMVVSPLMGLVMDKRGGQRFVCFGAMLSACFWFGIMGYAHAPPEMCIAFAGFSYSLLPASLYPLLPEFVPDESFTTVYAILNSLINLVFTVVLLIAGNVLGAGDVSELAATRRAGGGVAAFLGGGDDPAPPPAAEVDPARFDVIFAMFVGITGFGTLVTGALAYDAYHLMKRGVDLKPRKGAH
jgi:MFS family permease